MTFFIYLFRTFYLKIFRYVFSLSHQLLKQWLRRACTTHIPQFLPFPVLFYQIWLAGRFCFSNISIETTFILHHILIFCRWQKKLLGFMLFSPHRNKNTFIILHLDTFQHFNKITDFPCWFNLWHSLVIIYLIVWYVLFSRTDSLGAIHSRADSTFWKFYICWL